MFAPAPKSSWFGLKTLKKFFFFLPPSSCLHLMARPSPHRWHPCSHWEVLPFAWYPWKSLPRLYREMVWHRSLGVREQRCESWWERCWDVRPRFDVQFFQAARWMTLVYLTLWNPCFSVFKGWGWGYSKGRAVRRIMWYNVSSARRGDHKELWLLFSSFLLSSSPFLCLVVLPPYLFLYYTLGYDGYFLKFSSLHLLFQILLSKMMSANSNLLFLIFEVMV